jgi:hypothetical protein
VRFLLTLNHRKAIDERKVLGTFSYDHPVYSPQAVEAQARLRIASGQFEPGRLLFHPPGMVGAMGSAAGCGIVLGLIPVTLVGLFVAAWNQYRRGNALG